MPTCLLIVDVQKGFINPFTAHIPAAVARAQGGFDTVYASRFVNQDASPYRRLIGWHRFAAGSGDTAFAFAPRADATIIEKSVYTCVSSAFLGGLAADGIEAVHLCGIATDNCVLKTAADLFEAGLRPIVHAGWCASHGGTDLHDCALTILRRLIGADQVISD